MTMMTLALQEASKVIRHEVDKINQESVENNFKLYEIGETGCFVLMETGISKGIFYLMSYLTITFAKEVELLTTDGERTATHAKIREAVRDAATKLGEVLKVLKGAEFYKDMEGGNLGRENKGCPFCRRPMDESAS